MQGNAKTLYMLTDGDLKKLGSLAKANPQNKYALWTLEKLVGCFIYATLLPPCIHTEPAPCVQAVGPIEAVPPFPGKKSPCLHCQVGW